MQVFDLHIDLSSYGLTNNFSNFDVRGEIGKGFFPHQVDVPRLLEGNVKTFLGNICTIIVSGNDFTLPKNSLREFERQLELYKDFADKNNQNISLGFGSPSKINMSLSLEGVYFIYDKDDIGYVYQLKTSGIVSVSLTWNYDNKLGTGAGNVLSKSGLTDLGREFISACEDAGIIIDAVHASRKTFFDILEVAKKPVFVSHAASSEVFDHPRNLTKEQVQAIANQNGIIGLCFVSDFLGGNTIDSVIRHLKSLINLAGEDGVAIGSDFDGISRDEMIVGLEDASCFPVLFEECKKQGIKNSQIEKFAYKNAEKFFRDNLK